MYKLSFVIVLQLIISLSTYTYSQQKLLSLNFELQNNYEKALLINDKISFTAQRPFLFSDVNQFVSVDSITYLWGRDEKILSKMKHPMWWQKLRTEDLILVNSKGFQLKVNPLINFSFGKEVGGDRNLMINTRGVDISGNLGGKFSFGSGVYESQAFFPKYYSDFAKQRRVVPGQGRVRMYKDTGYDFSQAYGYLSFTPNKYFNFRIGHGKNFIGEGYRSLILSDNAFNMPYAKFTTSWKRLRFTNLLVVYQNTGMADGTSEISNRRYGSYTSVDLLVGEFLELGITESIVWKKKDSLDYSPNANLLNPFIFYRTFQYGMDGVNNVILGLNAKAKISKSIVSYGQAVFDDSEKVAFQVGAKWYDVFKLPLFLQMEYNMVKPFTYTHWDKQSYTHYNQEIAHPLGANFSEYIARARYSWKDLIFSYQFNYAETKLDENGLAYGNNIFAKYEKVDVSESSDISSVVNHSFKLAFLVNPSSNLQIYFESRIRSVNGLSQEDKQTYWLFGLKTNLQNLYTDF